LVSFRGSVFRDREIFLCYEKRFLAKERLEMTKISIMKSTLHPLTRSDAIVVALVFAASLALYVRTLAPDLLLGDSGEFQTVVYSLGMTHPTGYPVFVLLGRLFTLIPLGELAWRANLFIAVQGALAMACVYLIVRMLAGWRVAGVTAAFVLAVNPLVWFHAVIAELYLPACLFTAGVILLVLLWRQTGQWKFLAAAGLLGGLSLGVHSTVALIAPAVLLYLLLSTLIPRLPPEREKGPWFAAIGGAALGLALAFGAFLVLDAIDAHAGYYNATVRHALSAWDMQPADFDSPLERLEFLYTARQFSDKMFADPARVMPVNGASYWRALAGTFLPVGPILLMGVGMVVLLVFRWREGLLLLLGWGAQVLFALNYEVYDYYVFFIPSFVFLAVWAGIGLGAALTGLGRALNRIPRAGRAAKPVGAAAGAAVLLVTILFSSGMITRAWRDGRVTFAIGGPLDGYPYPIGEPSGPREDARALVDALEDDAIVFTNWDMLFPYYFVAHVEAGRTGMDFHEAYPQEGMGGLADSTLAYIKANIDRPIYFTERPQGAAGLVFKPVVRGGLRLYQITGLK
jgi:hypothetical protein